MTWSSRASIDWVRRGTVFLIAAGAALFWFAPGPISGLPNHCDTKTVTKERSVTTTKMCDSPSVADLSPLLLLVLLLLLPDVSEIELTGVLSLKRKVQEQQEKLSNQEHRQDELQRGLLQLGLQLSSVQMVSNQNASSAGAMAQVNILAAMDSKLATDSESKPTNITEVPNSGEPLAIEPSALLEGRRQTYQQLEQTIRDASAAASRPGADGLLQRWATLFRTEIDQFLSVANHLAEMSAEQLLTPINVGYRLEHYLRNEPSDSPG